MQTKQIYIDGQWCDSQATVVHEVINPSNEQVIAQVPVATEAEVDLAVEAARRAFPSWNALSVEERAHYLEAFLQELENNQEILAQIITEELGCSIQFSRQGQVPQSINEMKAVLSDLAHFKMEENVDDYTVVKEGYGVVACITPWNYPFNQIQRKLTPALLAGNTVVVKPSSLTPLSALFYAELMDRSGLPQGVFNLVTGSGSGTGAYLAGHPEVDVISFTGSTEVGRTLYHQAADTIKKLILELGGKSACIYLAGGDLEIAVRRSLSTVFNNQGQTCSALTRLLVPREEMYEVEEALLAYYQEHVKIGAPDKEDTTIGPLVSSTQRDTVMNYIQSGIEAEARLLIGGKSIDRVGYYVEPTIFTQVDNRMKIAQEEIFGPVLCVIPYDTVEEAIDLANDSIYGLSGCVVGPEDQAEAVARQLRTGNVFINDGYRNPRAPFGGYKLSGVGREIGLYGLEDYLEIKAILR